jgi:hypothetical protein
MKEFAGCVIGSVMMVRRGYVNKTVNVFVNVFLGTPDEL